VLDKVKLVEDRYEELNRLMADPEVFLDHTKVTEYSQEQSEQNFHQFLLRNHTEITINSA